MSAHTPGPWSIQFSSGNNGRAEYVHRLQFGVTIIQHLNGTTEKAIHANARLIAAAPELLEACEAFITLFNDCDMRPEDESHEVASIIRRAIAKARGEAK